MSNNYNYDALPCLQRALDLRYSLNCRLQESLIHILEMAREVWVNNINDRLIKHISSLEPEHKISSFYYMLNSYMISAIEQDSIEMIIGSIHNANYPLTKDQDVLEVLSYDYIPNFFQDILIQLASYDLQVKPVIHKIDKSLFIENKHIIEEAMQLVKEHASDIYEEAKAFLTDIIFLRGHNIKAGSSVGAFGLMYIEQTFAPTALEMVDIFVHEAAHQYLHGLSFEDELVLNPPDERYEAPLRKEKRSLLGIFHAAFVLARLIYTFDKLLSAASFTGDKSFLQQKREHYKLRYNHGCETLYKYAWFTEKGKTILDSTSILVS